MCSLIYSLRYWPERAGKKGEVYELEMTFKVTSGINMDKKPKKGEDFCSKRIFPKPLFALNKGGG